MSDRALYWRRLLSECEDSGLSQAEFCRRRGIQAGTLAWWKRRLRRTEDRGAERRNRRVSGPGHAGFVEVALRRSSDSVAAQRGWSSRASLAPDHVATPDRYELVLPGGVGLRLPDDFDPERVARLVQALAAAC
jgi:hypothetical protein